MENGREGGVSEDEECFRCFERVSEGEEVSRGKTEREFHQSFESLRDSLRDRRLLKMRDRVSE